MNVRISRSMLRNLVACMLAFWIWPPANADMRHGSAAATPHTGVSQARMSGMEGRGSRHYCCHAGTYRNACSPLAAHIDLPILVPKEAEPDSRTNVALPEFPDQEFIPALLAADGSTTDASLRTDNHPIYLTTLRLRL